MFSTKSIEKLESLLASTTEEWMRIDLLNQLSWQLHLEDKARAFSLAQEAYQLVLDGRFEYENGLADSLLNMCMYYTAVLDHTTAIKHANQALIIYKKSRNSLGQLRTAEALMRIYDKLGNYTQTLEFAFKALQIAQTLNDTIEIIRVQHRIAIVYTQCGDHDSAIVQYDQVEKLLIDQQNEDREIALVRLNSASSYRFVGKLDIALEKAQQALPFFMQTPDQQGRAICLGIIANIYYDSQQFEQSMSFHQQKLEIAEALNSDYLRAYTYGDIGRVYLGLGKIEQATEWLQTSIEVAKKGDFKQALERNLLSIVAMLKEQNNYEKALAYYEQLMALRNERFDEQSNLHRKNLMVVYETQEIQREAQYQRQRAEEAERLADEDRRTFIERSALIDEIVSAKTHDLKNPLTSILLNTQVLRSKVDPELQPYLDRIERQTTRMRVLIADMQGVA